MTKFAATIKPGNVIRTRIYSTEHVCRVLAVYDFGTVDVEVIATGNCYRITGLPFLRANAA